VFIATMILNIYNTRCNFWQWMFWKALLNIHWLRGLLHFTVQSTACTVVNMMIESVEYWCSIDIF